GPGGPRLAVWRGFQGQPRGRPDGLPPRWPQTAHVRRRAALLRPDRGRGAGSTWRAADPAHGGPPDRGRVPGRGDGGERLDARGRAAGSWRRAALPRSDARTRPSDARRAGRGAAHASPALGLSGFSCLVDHGVVVGLRLLARALPR